ncbi:MAG: hypothetical protein RID53_36105 [Coleofasciculus sp. B1-GNL1-01]|uniref:hypothetical protein n=1 Tax=Coleofasciculus sp. B1-GNL1-01 TaxID=3068484 RepID=UPI0032FCD790
MVNFGLNSATLLGLLDIFLSIAYLAISVALPIARRRDIGVTGIVLYIIQAIIAPLFLLMAGFILFFQGWRLDPILQFSYVLLNFLVIYLGVKDIILFRLLSPRNHR